MAETEVNVHIDAPPARVWELIGGPTRMGEWSPECRRVTWTRGADHPAVGVKFRGHNQRGWRRWSTTGTIVTFDPEHEISWDVDSGPLPVARWGYRIVPEPGGDACTVVESFRDRRGTIVKVLGVAARGVIDVDAHNRAGMEQTLARVKAAAESAT
jgi:uncharacterized protein YndB with AHSA1/START domain